MLAALTRKTFSRRAGSGSAKCGSHSDNIPFMRFPQGCSISRQQCFKNSTTAPWYWRGAPPRPGPCPFRRCPRKTLVAYLRSSPLTSQNSCKRKLRALFPVMRW